MSLPVHLRPPGRPRLVRLLNLLAAAAAVVALLGAPVWALMHASARGWTEDVRVEVTLPEDAECRVGPPPGRPRTCEATWTAPDGTEVEGWASDRYGGDLPALGATASARVVDDGAEPLAFAGFDGFLLRWALLAPYLAVGGGLVLVGAAVGLWRLDPRWASARTDLPRPGRPG